MTETVYRNGRIVLEDEVVRAELVLVSLEPLHVLVRELLCRGQPADGEAVLLAVLCVRISRAMALQLSRG